MSMQHDFQECLQTKIFTITTTISSLTTHIDMKLWKESNPEFPKILQPSAQ